MINFQPTKAPRRLESTLRLSSSAEWCKIIIAVTTVLLYATWVQSSVSCSAFHLLGNNNGLLGSARLLVESGSKAVGRCALQQLPRLLSDQLLKSTELRGQRKAVVRTASQKILCRVSEASQKTQILAVECSLIVVSTPGQSQCHNHRIAAMTDTSETNPAQDATNQDAPSVIHRSEAYSKKIRPTLDLLDELRGLLSGETSVQIDIPTLAVIGNQSSGKSSVLERLSHCPLPRGDGMVTKNPLVMSLRRASESSVRIGTSLDPGQMEEVRVEEVANRISALSEELVRRGDGRFEISELPIYLNINGPHLSDLTLIDLPGVYWMNKDKREIEGIRDFLKGLYAEYCSSPTCTIICVLSATEDVTTQIARGWCSEWDPKGDRSIGVLTKSDRVNDHKELCDRIAGIGANNAGFRLGTIALRNSSSPTTEYGQVEEEELGFFRDVQRKQRDLKDGSFGIQALVTALVEIQAKPLYGLIPKLASEVNKQLMEAKLKSDSLPNVVQGVADATAAVLLLSGSIFKAFDEMTDRVVEGSEFPKDFNYDARLAEMFDAFMVKMEFLSPGILSWEMHTKLTGMMTESRGAMLDDFLTARIFRSAIHDLIKSWNEPTRRLLSDVHNKMSEVLGFIVSRESPENDSVREWFQMTMSRFLKERHAECSLFLQQLSEMHQFINTRDERYQRHKSSLLDSNFFRALKYHILDMKNLGDDDKTISAVHTFLRSHENLRFIQSNTTLANENDTVNAIFSLQIQIYAYIKVARSCWVDCVCRFLRVKYVNFLQDHGEQYVCEVMKQLNEERLVGMWRESASAQAHRHRVRRSVEILEHADDLISKFLETVASSFGI